MPTTKTLAEGQRTTLVNALYTAADAYTGIAATYRSSPHMAGGGDAAVRLIDQFERQAKDAKELAEQIEQARDVWLS